MAHYKRKRTKEYKFVDCCLAEAGKASGNHRNRVSVRDLRQPQFYTGHIKIWRYKNDFAPLV